MWDLAKDVSGDIVAANPHADGHGNETVWHFYKGEMKTVDAAVGSLVAVPAGSLIAAWQEEEDAGKKHAIAERVQAFGAGESGGAVSTEFAPGAAAVSSRWRRCSRSGPARRVPARSCGATGSSRPCSASVCRSRRRTCPGVRTRFPAG